MSSASGGPTVWANKLNSTVIFQSLVYTFLNSYQLDIAWSLNYYCIPRALCWLALVFGEYLHPWSLRRSSLFCTPGFVNLWVLLISSGLGSVLSLILAQCILSDYGLPPLPFPMNCSYLWYLFHPQVFGLAHIQLFFCSLGCDLNVICDIISHFD